MYKTVFLFLLAPFICGAQDILRLHIVDATTKLPLPGVVVQLKDVWMGSSTDASGLVVLTGIPVGGHQLECSLMGYKPVRMDILIPLSRLDTIRIEMTPFEMELADVEVVSNRVTRYTSDLPTRVEVISGEELDEKSVSSPGTAKMILTESTGIQAQQTSVSSANMSFRIHGLDGKYTQLLRDGMPVFTGYSSGMSILQLPPLDLKQVEIIKGPSSTLYGGGAIAGVVNFISKEPSLRHELAVLVNGNQTGAADVSTYLAQKIDKHAFSLFVSANAQQGFDVNKDLFSDIPFQQRFNVNPKFYYTFSPFLKCSVVSSNVFEHRTSGFMSKQFGPIRIDNSLFYEDILSWRNVVQHTWEYKRKEDEWWTLKQSASFFNRLNQTNKTQFALRQWSGFSELNYYKKKSDYYWIAGLNHWWDYSHVSINQMIWNGNRQTSIVGAFVQMEKKWMDTWSIEAGLRLDKPNYFNPLVLPRLAILYKPISRFFLRGGMGSGYKLPGISSDEIDKFSSMIHSLVYSPVLKMDKSLGIFGDAFWKLVDNELVTLQINQLGFQHFIFQPFQVEQIAGKPLVATNLPGQMVSKGLETNVKLRVEEWYSMFGYTLVDVFYMHDGKQAFQPLSPVHRFNCIQLLELEGHGRLGYELFYTGKQQLQNGEWRPGYWVMGISGDFRWKGFTFFINAENFLNKTMFDVENSFAGAAEQPKFREVWAPTDGFILNMGIKWNKK